MTPVHEGQVQSHVATVRLRKGRVKPVWLGHPWVFAQAIDSVDGAPGPGDRVNVVDPRGQFLGSGYYSPKSAIPVRIMSRDPQEELESAAIANRFDLAAAWRRRLGFMHGDSGYRLMHAEGDAMPGVIADVYGEVVVVQLRTAGAKRREQEIFAHAARVSGAKTVIEAAADLERREGFTSEWRVVRGPTFEGLSFRDREFHIELPPSITQKTGYYFDQRANRAKVEEFADGARVLDAYSFVGGFGLAAARGGASEVICVDSSATAVAAGSAIAHANSLDLTFRREDVRKALQEMTKRHERFDIVIVDPPKLVPTRRHLDKGLRAYAALNTAAMRLVGPGGLFVSCSCSAAVRTEELCRVVAKAAADSHRRADVFYEGTQAADHPTPAAFPEGRYLDAVFARIVG